MNRRRGRKETGINGPEVIHGEMCITKNTLSTCDGKCTAVVAFLKAPFPFSTCRTVPDKYTEHIPNYFVFSARFLGSFFFCVLSGVFWATRILD